MTLNEALAVAVPLVIGGAAGVWRVSSVMGKANGLLERIADNDLPHLQDEVSKLRDAFINFLIEKDKH